jgi:predicted CXXCH cytochrome family protein
MRVGTAMLLAAFALAGAAASVRVQRIREARAWIGERAQLTPGLRARDRYLGSSACRGCHPDAWQSWHDSWHRSMTQLAASDTMLARWDDVVLPDGTRLRHDGARPVVERSRDGRLHVDPVVMTTGAHHMQLYWLPSATGDTLHALPWAWLVDEQRFVPNEATLLRPADDAVDYTWNRVCIRCHAVAGSPGWQAGTGAIDTRVVELGIACESCHGPGRAHAEARRAPWARRTAETPDATIVNPARLDPEAASQICAQCHSISLEHDEAGWLARGPAHAPPEALASWGTLVRHPLRADVPELDAVLEQDADYLVDRYWPDGMVRVTGREYGAMIESSCHAGGELSCLSCHAMHASAPDDQLRAGAEGDGACTQCHAAEAFATPLHTHHAAAGEGARCTNCHMPHTSWGLLGAIRSHEIDSPDPEIFADTGRPLACNLCHVDHSVGWAARWWAHWWRDAAEPVTTDTDPSAMIELLLAGDAGQRGLAAWHMAWPPARAIAGDDWQAELLLAGLDDPYPALRLVAWRSLAQLVDVAELPDGGLPSARDIEPIRAALASRPSSRHDRALLRHSDGTLDRVAVEALRKSRNDRRVALAE